MSCKTISEHYTSCSLFIQISLISFGIGGPYDMPVHCILIISGDHEQVRVLQHVTVVKLVLVTADDARPDGSLGGSILDGIEGRAVDCCWLTLLPASGPRG